MKILKTDWSFWACIGIILFAGLATEEYLKVIIIILGLLFVRYVVPKMF